MTVVDWSSLYEERQVGPRDEGFCAGEGDCVIVDGSLFNYEQGYESIYRVVYRRGKYLQNDIRSWAP